jgi:MarR family transcriptional regulator for hemolysin
MRQSDRHIPIDIGLLLHQAQLRATIPLNSVLKELGLQARHFAVLLLMHEQGVIMQRDLMARLITEKTAMIRVIDDLDRLDYITRSQSTEDRRLSILGFTEKGEAAFAEAQKRTQVVVDAFFEPLSAEEIDVFQDMLKRLIVAPQPTLAV